MTPTPNELTAVERRIDRMTREAWRGETKGAERPLLPPAAVRHVLVATDGAPPSDNALAWAEALGTALHPKVSVITVNPPRGALEAYDGAALEFFRDEEQHGRDILEEAAGRLRKAGLKPEPILASGAPAAEIIRTVQERDIDLVIVGTHGYGTVTRLLVGSVADAVMSRAPASVLVAKNEPPPDSLLLATDGSLASRRALQAGLLLREAFSTKAKALHVVSFPVFGGPERGKAAYDRVFQGLDLTPADELGLQFDLQYGKPADRISETAERETHGLVVLGHRGLGAAQALLEGTFPAPGSVSLRVAHTAKGLGAARAGPPRGGAGHRPGESAVSAGLASRAVATRLPMARLTR